MWAPDCAGPKLLSCQLRLPGLRSHRATVATETFRFELAATIQHYIELFHNTRRRHSALGTLSPAEYEDLHNTTQEAA